MLRVVLDKPTKGIIGVDEVTEDMIVVANYGGCLYKLGGNHNGGCQMNGHIWSRLEGCWRVHTKPMSIPDAIAHLSKEGAEVHVLSSLSELSSWIAENCGESGKGKEAETRPMKEGLFSFCRICGCAEKDFSEEPCASCRVGCPTNFKQR